MTRQKEAVSLWNLLKHEKDIHVTQLLEWCNLGDKDDSELSLYHEFNASSTKIGHDRAKTLLDYIKSINNPFGAGIRLQNISTGADGLFECLEIVEKSYQVFVETIFQDKEKHLHDRIPTCFRETYFYFGHSEEINVEKRCGRNE